MKEHEFVCKALNDFGEFKKGELLFVSMNGKFRANKLENDARAEETVFRVTNNETNHHTVKSLDGYHIVVPEGARFKVACAKINRALAQEQIDRIKAISAIADMKELYFRDKVRAGSFSVDEEFQDAHELFTAACKDGSVSDSFKKAFNAFLNLAMKYHSNAAEHHS